MFLVPYKATCALFPWPHQCLQISVHLWAVWKYSNQLRERSGLYTAWRRNFSFYVILLLFEDRPVTVPKQHQSHFASRRHTFEFLGHGQWNVFPLHALTFACRFIVVLPGFIACDNPLQESLSYFMILLKKLNACFYVCPFVLICKLLWYPPCTNFVIPEVLAGDGSTADVQLVGYISDSNPSVLLNQSINSFNIVCHLWSGQIAQAVFIDVTCSATLGPFHPLVHLPLCNTVFFMFWWNSFYESWRVLPFLATKIEEWNVA